MLFGVVAISPLAEGGSTHVAVMVLRLLILVACGLFVVHSVRSGEVRWPRSALGGPVGMFLVLALWSALTSPYQHQSFQWVLVLLSYAALLYLLVSFVTEWDHVMKLVAVLACVAGAESLMALIQAQEAGALRPSGSFFNPNFLAGYLAAVWSVLLALGLFAPMRVVRGRHARSRTRMLLLAAGAGLLLSAWALVLTGSRGGAVAWLVGTAIVLAVRFGFRGMWPVAVALVLAVLIPNPLRDRFYAEYLVNPLGQARWQIWASSLRQILDHPLGVGLGLYQYSAPSYMFPVEGQIMRYGRVAHTAHNEYLQIGVELGLAALLVFGWGIVACVREARCLLRRRLRRWHRAIAVGALAGAGSILVHAGLDATLHEPGIAILLICLVGLVCAGNRLAAGSRVPVRHLPLHAPRLVGVVGMVLVLVFMLESLLLGVAWLNFDAGTRLTAPADLEAAVSRYRLAATLDPGKALYHSALAAAHFRAFQRTGQPDHAQEALVELEVAASLNPLDGRLQERIGMIWQTLAWARPVRTPLTPEQERQRQTWLKAAETAYERALGLEPYSVFYRFELSRLAEARGDRATATARLEEAVTVEPNFLAARAALARLSLLADNRTAAEGQLREIQERRQRYATWTKNEVEARLLAVDTATLEAVLRKGPQPI